MSSNLNANWYVFATECRKFYLFPVWCHDLKKVGKYCCTKLIAAKRINVTKTDTTITRQSFVFNFR